MIMSLVLISGLLLAAGLCCLVVAFARPTPRLEAALEQVAPTARTASRSAT